MPFVLAVAAAPTAAASAVAAHNRRHAGPRHRLAVREIRAVNHRLISAVKEHDVEGACMELAPSLIVRSGVALRVGAATPVATCEGAFARITGAGLSPWPSLGLTTPASPLLPGQPPGRLKRVTLDDGGRTAIGVTRRTKVRRRHGRRVSVAQTPFRHERGRWYFAGFVNRELRSGSFAAPPRSGRRGRARVPRAQRRHAIRATRRLDARLIAVTRSRDISGLCELMAPLPVKALALTFGVPFTARSATCEAVLKGQRELGLALPWPPPRARRPVKQIVLRHHGLAARGVLRRTVKRHRHSRSVTVDYLDFVRRGGRWYFNGAGRWSESGRGHASSA